MSLRLRQLLDEQFALLEAQRVELDRLYGGAIRLQPGDDVQAAVDQLIPTGGLIQLPPGDYGWVTIPERPLGAAPLILAADLALDEGRINRQAMLPTIRGVTGRNRSRHVQFVGIRFSNGNPDFTLVAIGGDRLAMPTPADLPEGWSFDRCIWQGHPATGARRGLRPHGRNIAVVRSVFVDCFNISREAQAIVAWNGGQQVLVDDCYLEGGSQSLLLGGGDAASAEMRPSDWTIRKCDLAKNPAWPTGVTRKFHFEIKDGRRVLFEDNRLVHWHGSGIMLKACNQDGTATFATVEDVTLRRNVLDGCGYAFAVVAKCDAAGPGTERAEFHTARARNILIEDNIGRRIGSGIQNLRRFLYVVNTPDRLTVQHNTVIVDQAHSWVMGSADDHNLEGPMPSAPDNFRFEFNIALNGEYTTFGSTSVFPPETRVIAHNVFGAGIRPTNPGGVTISEADVRASLDADFRVLPGSPVAVASAGFPEPVGARV